MSTTEERINNAIATMGPVARRNLRGPRLDAFLALERHWATFWRSSERALTPTLELGPKLKRYVQWYTRAWALLPSSARALVVQPDAIDVRFADAARDTLKAYLLGMESSAQAAKDAQAWADEKARELRASIDAAGDKAQVLGLAVLALLGLGAYWYFGRGRA